MDEIRWILGVLTGLLSLCAITMNWAIFFHNINPRKNRFVSAAPLLGGISGVASLLLIPIPGLSRWWWAPLFLDWGSIPVYAVSGIIGLIEQFQGKQNKARNEADSQRENSDSEDVDE
jgi:hypothetical protein